MLLWILLGSSACLFVLWLKCADRDVSLYLCKLFCRSVGDYFSNKVVFITGASQGLGERLALTLSRMGCKLILSARNVDKLKNVASRCGGDNNVHIIPFDLRTAKWDAIASEILSSFPEGLDFVIHNAGISQHSLASTTKPHIVEDLFQLNATGPIALTQALLPGMLKQNKGHFIIISSMAGKVFSPGQAIYAATKFAVLGYFHTLRTELAATPINVTICCPGPFKTAGERTTRQVYGSDGLKTEEIKRPKGLDADQAIEMILAAAKCKVWECWMAKQPVLLMAYLVQYFPRLGTWILNRIGPRRARAVEKGEGYSMEAILNSNKKSI